MNDPNGIPYAFTSEAANIVYKLRRELDHVPTRFQMMRIADHIRRAEWDSNVAENRRKTLAAAKVKSAATRAKNKDPFGFKAQRLAAAEYAISQMEIVSGPEQDSQVTV